MSCDGIRLEDRILGFLDGREREEVDRHLATCDACRAEAEQVRTLVSKLEELPASAPVNDALVARALRAAPRKRKRTLEVLVMMTAASLMLGWLAYFTVGPPLQDSKPAKQDAPRAKEIDQLVDRLGHNDVEERDKAEKAIVALARDLEHAFAALEKARASNDTELKLRAERAANALIDELGRIRTAALARLRPPKEVLARSREDLDRLNERLKSKPDDVDAMIERARVYLDLGEAESALRDAETAIRLVPVRAEAFTLRARARAAQGDGEGALEDVTRALEIDPAKAEAWLARARMRLARKAFGAAISDYDAAIRLDPAAAEAYGFRAEARRAYGDLEGAKADFEESLRLKKK